MAISDRDFPGWFEPYTESFGSFGKAQQDGFRTFERFARFQYAVAGDLLEAGLAHARTALDGRSTVGTQVIADILQKQAALGTQLSEKLKARAHEFSALAAEVQESVNSFAADAANRTVDTADRTEEMVSRSRHVNRSRHSSRQKGRRTKSRA